MSAIFGHFLLDYSKKKIELVRPIESLHFFFLPNLRDHYWSALLAWVKESCNAPIKIQVLRETTYHVD